MAGIHYNSDLCSTAICIDCCGCEQYNKALEDFEMKIKECCSVIGSCDFEDMVKIKEQLMK